MDTKQDATPTPLDKVRSLTITPDDPLPEGMFLAPFPETREEWRALGFTFRHPPEEK